MCILTKYFPVNVLSWALLYSVSSIINAMNRDSIQAVQQVQIRCVDETC